MTKSLITDLVYPCFTLEVHYDYTPGDPGQLSGPPEKCYPPEDEEFDITEVRLKWPAQIPGSILDIQRLDMPDELGFIDHITNALREKMSEQPDGPEED